MHGRFQDTPTIDIISSISRSDIVRDDLIRAFVPLYHEDMVDGSTIREIGIIQFFPSKKHDDEVSFIDDLDDIIIRWIFMGDRFELEVLVEYLGSLSDSGIEICAKFSFFPLDHFEYLAIEFIP